MKRIVLLCLLSCAVAGCEDANVAEVKAAVAAELRDPESAKFTDVRRGEKNWVCGHVNGKNAFGAYAGGQRFVGLGKQFVTVEPALGDPMREMFEENWAECMGLPKPRSAIEVLDKLDADSAPTNQAD